MPQTFTDDTDTCQGHHRRHPGDVLDDVLLTHEGELMGRLDHEDLLGLGHDDEGRQSVNGWRASRRRGRRGGRSGSRRRTSRRKTQMEWEELLLSLRSVRGKIGVWEKAFGDLLSFLLSFLLSCLDLNCEWRPQKREKRVRTTKRRTAAAARTGLPLGSHGKEPHIKAKSPKTRRHYFCSDKAYLSRQHDPNPTGFSLPR